MILYIVDNRRILAINMRCRMNESLNEKWINVEEAAEYLGIKPATIKVVSIHSLKSASTIIEILEEYKTQKNNKYIFHWFTGSMSQLKKAIELGGYFSINPRMLKTKSGLEVINTVPIERMLLETDAPFTAKPQHVEDIEIELRRVVSKISEIVKKT